MKSREDAFWEELRRARDAAEDCEDSLQPQDPNNEGVLAEAEALLQELDAEAEAEAELAPQAQDHQEPTAAATSAPPAASNRTVQLAAAVLLAPKFLLAASAATVVAVTAMVLQNTTRSLPFQDAVRILMDERAPNPQREAAQGRVYFSCIESILMIQDAAAPAAQTSNAATSALARIRAELSAPEASSPREFDTPREFDVPLSELIARAADPDLKREQRIGSLGAVTARAIYGLQALRTIAQSAGPDGLKASNAAHLERIARLVAR